MWVFVATLKGKRSARRSAGGPWRWGGAAKEPWKATASEKCSQENKYPVRPNTHTHFSVLAPLPIRGLVCLFVLFYLAYLGTNRHHLMSCCHSPTGQGLKRPSLINIWRKSTLWFGAEMPVGLCFTNVSVVLSLLLMQMRHRDFFFFLRCKRKTSKWNMCLQW